MEIFAFDVRKYNNGWFKHWDSIGVHHVFDCRMKVSRELALTTLATNPCGLVLIHREPCEDLLGGPESPMQLSPHYIMWVDGGGNDDVKEDADCRSVNIHFSKRKVPSGSSLAYLKSDLDRLRDQLEFAGRSEEKVRAAWQEWEHSEISRFLSLISPLVLDPANMALAVRVARSLEHRSCQEIADRVDANSNAGMNGLAELVDAFAKSKKIVAAQRLIAWVQQFPNVPADIARRYL